MMTVNDGERLLLSSFSTLSHPITLPPAGYPWLLLLLLPIS
jgi:hypothetical protein